MKQAGREYSRQTHIKMNLNTTLPTPANQSFGLQVAKLADIPDEVLEVAHDKLLELEQCYVAADEVE